MNQTNTPDRPWIASPAFCKALDSKDFAKTERFAPLQAKQIAEIRAVERNKRHQAGKR